MRGILFRGKQVDTGEWVFGLPFLGLDEEIDGIEAGVSCKDLYTIAPETLGQYTGLTDKNGNLIFEGDIIRTHYANTRKKDFVEQVVFHKGRFCSLYDLRGPGTGKMWSNLPDGVKHFPMDKQPYMEWCEIIGNIYDNPELLDGVADNG